MKKKMISLFLCGMMAVTAIVGCGGSGETKSEESGSEVVEIEFWYGLGGKLGETMESIINDFYQFTLTRLMNKDIDSDGVSPVEIFGLQRTDMEKILKGLSVNYPEFINEIGRAHV